MPTLDVAALPGAACRGVTEPLWDDRVYGETPQQRGERHRRGRAICRSCPARTECLAESLRLRETAPTVADRPVGIWGGHLITQGTDTEPRQCLGCDGQVYGGRKYCSPRCRYRSDARRARARRGVRVRPTGLDPIAVNNAVAGRIPGSKLSRDERIAAVDQLTKAGWSIAQIAARLRIAESTTAADRRHQRAGALPTLQS